LIAWPTSCGLAGPHGSMNSGVSYGSEADR
jgi:hypothetical protein